MSDEILLTPPDADEVAVLGRGVVSAVSVGSAGPWAPGGITPFQLRSAQTAAQAGGFEYRPWQPDPRHA